MSQPTFSQTSLSQGSPVLNDAAYVMSGQSQQFQPDVKLLTEQAGAGFEQDLNQGKYIIHQILDIWVYQPL